MSQDCRLVELFQVLVQQSHLHAVKANLPEGVPHNLNIVLNTLAKIRSMPKTIGVFGPPKRGKSTLLNVLLHESIMPTSPIPMTKTVIEAHHANLGEELQVTAHFDDGYIEHQSLHTADHVRHFIEITGSYRGDGPAVAKIVIRGSFPDSRILQSGGVLIDTPGAEVAFEHFTDDPLAKDTKRALDILGQVHVVLFCVRADQIGSKSDDQFYQRHMRLLRPLNVVTFKDAWNGQADLCDQAIRAYKFPRERVLPVSSRPEAKIDSGVPELENRILMEISDSNPVEGLLGCVLEYETICNAKETQLKAVLRPEQIYVDHFVNAIGDRHDGAFGGICQSMDRLKVIWGK